MKKHMKEMEDLAKILQDWYSLEDETIKLAEEQMKKSDNSFVKVVMEMIKRDSEKHKAMQQYAINHLINEATKLDQQDLIPLADILDKHMEAEAKSMGLGNMAMTKSKEFFTDFIISYLMSDEIKHHEMLTRLDHIKGKLYPYGQAREERMSGARM